MIDSYAFQAGRADGIDGSMDVLGNHIFPTDEGTVTPLGGYGFTMFDLIQLP